MSDEQNNELVQCYVISCKRLTQVNSTHTKPSRNVIKKCTAKMMQQTMQTKQPCRQKRNNISLMKEMNFFFSYCFNGELQTMNRKLVRTR